MLTLFLAITGGISWNDALDPLWKVSTVAVVSLVLCLGSNQHHVLEGRGAQLRLLVLFAWTCTCHTSSNEKSKPDMLPTLNASDALRVVALRRDSPACRRGWGTESL
ncbi:unnamed protein product [Symbiodinium sp. CCMP2592]|nr:unnamed protein product [Symbiodinium sp. CCMP2592]